MLFYLCYFIYAILVAEEFAIFQKLTFIPIKSYNQL